jgi:hypothetical protein
LEISRSDISNYLADNSTGFEVVFADSDWCVIHGLGDINGDHINDILLLVGNHITGVLYGKPGTYTKTITNWNNYFVNSTLGFTIFGKGLCMPYYYIEDIISSSQDFNGDGLSDFSLHGFNPYSPLNSETKQRYIYVIYGQEGYQIKNIDSQKLRGTRF